MKQLHKQLYLLLLVYMGVTVQAQNFRLLDINKSQNGNPTNNTIFEGYDWGRMDTYYAVYGGISYFSADDGIHGAELWRSDGTSSGTYLIKDINPGSSSSNVRDITISGGKIYFTATDGVSQQTIWITNGTADGTAKVADLNDGSSNPTYLTDVNGILYFFVDGYYGYYPASQLRKTDGTSIGTQIIADFNSPEFNYSYGGRQITNVNGRVFFSLANYGYNNELYTSDGSYAGTQMITNNPYANTNPTYLTAFNGLLYFSANDVNGTMLWRSDGTVQGTYAVNNNNNIYLDNNTVMRFTIKGNSIYFTGYTSDGNGTKFCKYDASDAANNVEIVKDINPGIYCRNLYNITNVNGNLFFTVYNGTDQVLYKSDGTTAGTMQVKDINPGGHNIYLYKHFENANGILFFSFYDDIHGYELWKSDGTGNGTTIVKEINKGVYGSAVTNISYLKDNITLFEAYDGKTGLELWSTDGTAAGTKMVKNINQSISGSSDPVGIVPAPDNKNFIFSAYDPQYGHEMRISDGTESGTHVIKDIYKGSFDSWPYLPVNFKNETYFFAGIDDPVAHYSDDIFLVSRLWKTDGTEKGTSMLSVPALETLLNGSGYVVSGVSTDNLLYLLTYNFSTNAYELWRSDGTGAGTYAIKTDISNYYYPVLTAVGKTLFFTNYDDINNYGLWETDGTAAGTKFVPLSGGSFPQGFYAFKNKLYFTAYDASYNSYLWVSDGSIKGTKIVSTVYVASWTRFAQTNDKLFFTAGDNNTTAGFELWATDGTERGTKLVKDIYPGDYNSSFPAALTSAGNLIYFVASENLHGFELWKSDGTARGTQLVKDITPGIDGSYGITNLTALKNQLYFLKDTAALWTSNGTPGGTYLVNDKNLDGIYILGNMIAFGNKLCFTAFSSSTGVEIWAGNVGGADPQRKDLSTDNPISNIENISALTSIYPDPASNILNVRITSTLNSKMSLVITDVTGKPVLNNIVVSSGTISQINISNLPAGTYFLKIVSANVKENVVKKFVKM